MKSSRKTTMRTKGVSRMRRLLAKCLHRSVRLLLTGGVLVLIVYVVILQRITNDVSVQVKKQDSLFSSWYAIPTKEEQRSSFTLPQPNGTHLPQMRAILLAGRPRQNPGYLTIGIPTLKRPKAEYFFDTLKSLFKQSSPQQQRVFTLVVMVADRDHFFNNVTVNKIKEAYPRELEEGLLQVISAPDTEHLFTDPQLKRTFNDSIQRVQWRSKQNLDYAALMEYSIPLSTYYLQIEDDVQAAPNYIQHIQTFVQQQASRHWAGLEVCPHGFIGKLFRSADLPKLITLLKTFYLEMPCDFLIGHFYKLMLQTKVISRKGTLFFHQGKYSSLTNVTRKTDKIRPGGLPLPSGSHRVELPKLRQAKLMQGHQNPQAHLYTSMTVWKTYRLQHAYDLNSGSFFWGKNVKEGDYVTIVFEGSLRLKRVVVQSGISDGKSKTTRKDKIQNATVEAGEDVFIGAQGSKVLCTDTHEAGEFRDGRFDSTIDSELLVRCITILITQAQREWVAIPEIGVFTQDEDSNH